MSYKVQTTLPFERDTKKLFKKYPSLKTDLLEWVNSLEIDALQGVSQGNDFYK